MTRRGACFDRKRDLIDVLLEPRCRKEADERAIWPRRETTEFLITSSARGGTAAWRSIASAQAMNGAPHLVVPRGVTAARSSSPVFSRTGIKDRKSRSTFSCTPIEADSNQEFLCISNLSSPVKCAPQGPDGVLRSYSSGARGDPLVCVDVGTTGLLSEQQHNNRRNRRYERWIVKP